MSNYYDDLFELYDDQPPQEAKDAKDPLRSSINTILASRKLPTTDKKRLISEELEKAKQPVVQSVQEVWTAEEIANFMEQTDWGGLQKADYRSYEGLSTKGPGQKICPRSENIQSFMHHMKKRSQLRETAKNKTLELKEEIHILESLPTRDEEQSKKLTALQNQLSQYSPTSRENNPIALLPDVSGSGKTTLINLIANSLQNQKESWIARLIPVSISFNGQTDFVPGSEDFITGTCHRILSGFYLGPRSSGFAAVQKRLANLKFSNISIAIEAILITLKRLKLDRDGILLMVDEIARTGDRDTVLKNLKALVPVLNDFESDQFNLFITSLEPTPGIALKTASGRTIDWIVGTRLSQEDCLEIFRGKGIKPNLPLRRAIEDTLGHPRSVIALLSVCLDNKDWSEQSRRKLLRMTIKKYKEFGELIRPSDIQVKIALIGKYFEIGRSPPGLNDRDRSETEKMAAHWLNQGVFVGSGTVESDPNEILPVLSPLSFEYYVHGEETPSDPNLKSCIESILLAPDTMNAKAFEEFDDNWESTMYEILKGQTITLAQLYHVDESLGKLYHGYDAVKKRNETEEFRNLLQILKTPFEMVAPSILKVSDLWNKPKYESGIDLIEDTKMKIDKVLGSKEEICYRDLNRYLRENALDITQIPFGRRWVSTDQQCRSVEGVGFYFLPNSGILCTGKQLKYSPAKFPNENLPVEAIREAKSDLSTEILNKARDDFWGLFRDAPWTKIFGLRERILIFKTLWNENPVAPLVKREDQILPLLIDRARAKRMYSSFWPLLRPNFMQNEERGKRRFSTFVTPRKQNFGCLQEIHWNSKKMFFPQIKITQCGH